MTPPAEPRPKASAVKAGSRATKPPYSTPNAPAKSPKASRSAAAA